MTFHALGARGLKFVAFALVLVASLFVSRSASAQATIAIVNEASLPRLNKDGATIQKRPLNLNPEGVNLQDCVDDQKIRFTLQMANFEANSTIQAYASTGGADCKDQLPRNGASKVCWALGSNIPLQTVVDVDIPVRKIMSGSPPFNAQTPDETANACGKVDLSTISVHFLYFAPGNPSTAASSKNVSVIIDTVGPSPPSGLRALPGNTRISVQWNSISGGGDSGAGATGGGLTALTGVRVYCSPAGAAPVAVSTPNPAVCQETVIDGGFDDAGNAIDAGTELDCIDGGSTTTTATSGECASPNFVNADGSKLFPTADFNAKYGCGSITGNSGTTVVASAIGPNALVNGTRYAVAVAATDAYGNDGPLSDVVCETPAVTTDFWEDYKNAGGHAGGGCATTGEDLPLGSVSVIAAVAALAVSSLRRRRRGSMKRTRGSWMSRVGLAGLALAGCVLTAADAQAVEFGTPAREHPYRSPQNFALELRFSPYRPAVDEEPGLRGTPFKDRFGENPRLAVGLEIDWQMFRIPYVGTIGPGLGASIVGMSRDSLTKENPPRPSGDSYSLDIYPFYLSAVLRADAFWRDIGIPFVPYAKLGIGYGIWRASNSLGTATAGGLSGKGGTWGTHVALGLAFALDALDNGASRNMDNAIGINNTYFYAEYYWLTLNGIGQDKALYVGTNTYAMGLAFEF